MRAISTPYSTARRKSPRSAATCVADSLDGRGGAARAEADETSRATSTTMHIVTMVAKLTLGRAPRSTSLQSRVLTPARRAASGCDSRCWRRERCKSDPIFLGVNMGRSDSRAWRMVEREPRGNNPYMYILRLARRQRTQQAASHRGIAAVRVVVPAPPAPRRRGVARWRVPRAQTRRQTPRGPRRAGRARRRPCARWRPRVRPPR